MKWLVAKFHSWCLQVSEQIEEEEERDRSKIPRIQLNIHSLCSLLSFSNSVTDLIYEDNFLYSRYWPHVASFLNKPCTNKMRV